MNAKALPQQDLQGQERRERGLRDEVRTPVNADPAGRNVEQPDEDRADLGSAARGGRKSIRAQRGHRVDEQHERGEQPRPVLARWEQGAERRAHVAQRVQAVLEAVHNAYSLHAAARTQAVGLHCLVGFGAEALLLARKRGLGFGGVEQEVEYGPRLAQNRLGRVGRAAALVAKR